MGTEGRPYMESDEVKSSPQLSKVPDLLRSDRANYLPTMEIGQG